ncbi:hypothetical protein P0Y35_02110 [Kiritimatiellaeota bacterium B1221]|nr:hypothetical protein [Kiritimatiellaeota bacterium B1221]
MKFTRIGLGGPWECWREQKYTHHFNAPWQEISLPHSWNGFDCVDPDVPYFEGDGWFRGLYTDFKQFSLNEIFKVDHFLHVEWGDENHAGRQSENSAPGLDLVEAGQGADEQDGDYSLAGLGRLIDNLGTVQGSRNVHTVNGRSQISYEIKGQPNVLGVHVEGLPPGLSSDTPVLAGSCHD